MEINWDLIRFQYEILGSPLEDLAREHEITLPVLRYNADTWEPIPLAQQKALQFPDVSSLEVITKEMTKQVKNHARAASVLKQRYLGPKYIALEALILSKATMAMTSLDVKDPRAANSIRTITSVMKELLEQNSILHVDSEKEDLGTDSAPTKWEVKFVDSETPDTEET